MALPMATLYSFTVDDTTARATWAAPPAGCHTHVVFFTYPYPNGPWNSPSPVDYYGTSATWSAGWMDAHQIAIAYVNSGHTEGSPDWTYSGVAGSGPQSPQNVTYFSSRLNVTVSYTAGQGATQTQYDRHANGTVELINYPSGTFNTTFEEYNTYYDIWIRSYNEPWDATGAWKVVTVKTGSNPASLPPPTPAQPPSILSRFDKGYNVTWGASAGATSYELRIRADGYSHYGYYPNLTEAFPYTTGQYGDKSWWSVRANNQYGSSDYTSEVDLIIQPDQPTITGIGASGGITITCSYEDFGNATIYGYRTVTDAPLTPQTSSSGGSVTFSGLEVGIQYYFKAIVTSFGVDSPQSEVIYVIAGYSRPTDFSWATPKIQGQAFSLTDDEVNNLTTTINGFRQYKNLATVSFVTITTGSKLTANMFNLIVSTISSMSPSILPPSIIADPQPIRLQDRDRITADRLNGIAVSLNSIT